MVKEALQPRIGKFAWDLLGRFYAKYNQDTQTHGLFNPIGTEEEGYDPDYVEHGTWLGPRYSHFYESGGVVRNVSKGNALAVYFPDLAHADEARKRQVMETFHLPSGTIFIDYNVNPAFRRNKTALDAVPEAQRDAEFRKMLQEVGMRAVPTHNEADLEAQVQETSVKKPNSDFQDVYFNRFNDVYDPEAAHFKSSQAQPMVGKFAWDLLGRFYAYPTSVKEYEANFIPHDVVFGDDCRRFYQCGGVSPSKDGAYVYMPIERDTVYDKHQVIKVFGLPETTRFEFIPAGNNMFGTSRSFIEYKKIFSQFPRAEQEERWVELMQQKGLPILRPLNGAAPTVSAPQPRTTMRDRLGLRDAFDPEEMRARGKYAAKAKARKRGKR